MHHNNESSSYHRQVNFLLYLNENVIITGIQFLGQLQNLQLQGKINTKK